MENPNAGSRRSILVTAIFALLGLVVYAYLTIQDIPITPFQALKAVIKFFLFLWGRIRPDEWAFLLDAFLFSFGFLLFFAFFAQFVLPVRTIEQRLRVIMQMFLYIVKGHGEMVTVRDGVPIHKVDRDSRGPGFVLLDTASAAVLRDSVSFTRTVGPGLVFTGMREYIAGTIDLHIQFSPNFGPRGDEDPFAQRAPHESVEDYQQRQDRRHQTSGLTRDGVEVVPNIRVLFGLDPGQEVDQLAEADRAFGYYPQSVYQAITGQTVVPGMPALDPDLQQTPWMQLPAFLAINLWREYLRKFTLNQLFNSFEQGEFEGKTAYEVIQDKVKQRMTTEMVQELNGEGNPTGGELQSREYLALKSRSIRIVSASIKSLRFPLAIETQLVNQWFAYWEFRAREEREFVERKRSYAIHTGQQEALKEFSIWSARSFPDEFLRTPRPATRAGLLAQMYRTIEYLLRGTLRKCVSDTGLHQRLFNEERRITRIIDWLQRQEPS